ncbi:RagB/SusD family nutrient uptake outer membrane protein [Parabacteroides pacaensis]|uniref:RagB/SusD family nutrient uptake outer membrane protein n=1 Tax=Parabacteroides pacaensis TaxID=2086575 RepID=UPI001F1E4769|nr:RagB/SusD family nutrient uptake outer membrane protein [Parabacteroides pacaensis]
MPIGYRIFKYGEVLLNYAGAKYGLDATIATKQLNLLRKRVGMPEFTVNLRFTGLKRIP